MDDVMMPLSEAALACGLAPRVLAAWLAEDGAPARMTKDGRMSSRHDLRRSLEARGLPPPPELRSWPRVLIVEDDASAAKLEERVLRALWPYGEVKVVGDGRAAAAEIASGHHDLIVMDLGLPGVSGIELCSMARSVRDLESTRILVVSGSCGGEANEAAFDRGADECLCKPFSVADFERTARRLLL